MVESVIKTMGEEFADYLHDESRRAGWAESISFPRNESELRDVVRQLHKAGLPFTVQGGRTGLACGATPQGGHILNLSRMERLLDLSRDERGNFLLTVEPGLTLARLRQMLTAKKLENTVFDEAAQALERELRDGPEQFFSPDPTETSATLGGMAACNASGARSYLYGPVRRHITGLRLVLADGDALDVKRGQYLAQGRRLSLTTEGGRHIAIDLPSYAMPQCKNASGYYAAEDMDAIDLFIGSDGSLGVISQLQLRLLPLPEVMWGVTCFFTEEEPALSLVEAVRSQLDQVAALEYFDSGVLELLRGQRAQGGAFAALPPIPEQYHTAIYCELHCPDEAAAVERLFRLGRLMEAQGGREQDTWVARTVIDRDSLIFFRHAAPEVVNMLIDQRRREYPDLAKLGTDMSVPDQRLHQVMDLYRRGLAENGLQSAIWGHVGDNHLHVNILPRNDREFAQGKELYEQWARAISGWGGAVSAEHGIGKLKAPFLQIMYGPEQVAAMARVKAGLDPDCLVGPGNLFPPELARGAKEVSE